RSSPRPIPRALPLRSRPLEGREAEQSEELANSTLTTPSAKPRRPRQRIRRAPQVMFCFRCRRHYVTIRSRELSLDVCLRSETAPWYEFAGISLATWWHGIC